MKKIVKTKKRKTVQITPDQKLLDIIIETARSKKGGNITVVNLAGIFSLADYFVMITGKNLPHIKTLADYIQDSVAQKLKIKSRRVGLPESRWLILDYGNIIVHIIGALEREHYALEQLWSKAPVTYHY